ncbi:calbindin-32-like [Liolophura sinensis]|uniref:calbindin-32-like n=1 Tax=Liolophura sinensis TaxID=3198878 RepID=UPI0031583D4F
MTLVFTRAAVVTSLLTSQTVLGFAMIDLLRAARQSDKSPADALAGVILTELDANKDNKITFAELGSYVDNVLVTLGSDQGSNDEVKGYVLTVGSLMDVDDNGEIDTSELQQTTSSLVSLAGGKQLGRALFLLTELKERNTADRLVEAEDIAVDFLNILDSDSDGLAGSDEIDAFLSNGMFGWNRDTAEEVIQEVDEDNNGNLSPEELDGFLITLATDYTYLFSRLYVYVRVYQLTGIDRANEFAEILSGRM